MLLVGFVLAAAGFTSLAFAMERHEKQLWANTPSSRRRWSLRSAGTGLIIGSMLGCVQSSGWSIGLVEWVGLLTLTAIGVVLGLIYWRKSA